MSFERDSLVYDPRGKQEVNPERVVVRAARNVKRDHPEGSVLRVDAQLMETVRGLMAAKPVGAAA